MNLVVDTSVWSLVLRRARVEESNPFVHTFRWHIQKENGIFLIGSILQELLDGVKTYNDFKRLLKILNSFPLVDLNRDTYIAASRLRNFCRLKGVHAGPVDFLIAAACIEHGYPLLTADRDFSKIANLSDLEVLPATG